jgi:penicillin-binding protein A
MSIFSTLNIKKINHFLSLLYKLPKPKYTNNQLLSTISKYFFLKMKHSILYKLIFHFKIIPLCSMLYFTYTIKAINNTSIYTILQQPSTTFIDPLIQNKLNRYLRNHNNPISAIAVADVKTGNILALAEGRRFIDNKNLHTSFFAGFPAASIYKIVPTIILLENLPQKFLDQLYIYNNCRLNKIFSPWHQRYSKRNIKLSRAYGLSCNNFFAKMGLSFINIMQLKKWSSKLGWNKKIAADFSIPISKINFPAIKKSSMYNIGTYYAGFGNIGLSPLHALWIALSIANNGYSMPLTLHKSTKQQTKALPLFSYNTAIKLRQYMHSTVQSGTSSSVFNKRRYKRLKRQTGGKTGSLSSKYPKGKINWFIGLFPYKNPKIVVSSIVVYNNKWTIKATHLAAEAILLWTKANNKKQH